MSKSSIVSSAARLIDVLRALNQQPVSTVHDLHLRTGLAKPGIVRLLRTLESKGLVSPAPGYGAYRLTSQVVSLSSGYHGWPRIVESAACVLDELTQEIKWPLAIAVYDREAVTVCYSTIPKSPLSLLPSTVNMRLSLVSRSMGRAYLAHCSSETQRVLLSVLADSRFPEDEPARKPQAVLDELARIADRGYALRRPGVRPVSSTLALPVFDKGQIKASLGLTWFSSVLATEDAVQRFLPPMRQAAARIERRLCELADVPTCADEPLHLDRGVCAAQRRPHPKPHGPKLACSHHEPRADALAGENPVLRYD
ncbi:MAG: DNA-binding transcriptional regulator [Pigmentiphaga sp.]